MEGTAYEVVVGAFMPLIIDFINSKLSDEKQRYAASVGVCLVIGVLFNLDRFDVKNILASGAVVFASAQTVYKTWWRNSDARTKLFPDVPERK